MAKIEMLILKRKVGESVIIEGDVVITIVVAKNGTAKVAIDAPPHKSVRRHTPNPTKENNDVQ